MRLSRRALSSGSGGCVVYDLVSCGLTDYDAAWRYQKALCELLHEQRAIGAAAGAAVSAHPDVILLVQHRSVYTLGRGADAGNVKLTPAEIESDPGGTKVVRTERGGEVTWHGPGQVVAYPVFDLHRHKKDLHWWARSLEEVVIQAIARMGVQGRRSPVNSGVWVGDNKLSAIGISATRWITYHGIALNVSCDMARFESIVPCGITTNGVCKLDTLAPPRGGEGEAERLDRVCSELIRSFGDVFGVRVDRRERSSARLDELLDSYPAIKSARVNIADPRLAGKHS